MASTYAHIFIEWGFIWKYVQKGDIMQVQKTSIRINRTVYERIKLLAKQDNVSIKQMINELLELGVLEKIKEGSNEKK